MKADKLGDGPHILLAEDDEDDQEMILLAFNNIANNHKIDVVNNGKEAIEHLMSLKEDELPCLIVLDLNMPILNGVETLKVLENNSKYRKIPKVVFSTASDEATKTECLSSGAADFLVKPSDLGNIMKSAKKMLQYCE